MTEPDSYEGDLYAWYKEQWLGDRVLSLRSYPESLTSTEEPLLWAPFPLVTRNSPNIVWRVTLKVWKASLAPVNLLGAIDSYYGLFFAGKSSLIVCYSEVSTNVARRYPYTMLKNINPGAYDDVSRNYFDDALTFEFTSVGTPTTVWGTV